MVQAAHEKYSRPGRFLGGHAERARIGGPGGEIVRRGNPFGAREGTERPRPTQRVWLRSGGNARPHADVEPPDCRDRAKLTDWQKEIEQTGVGVTLHEPVGAVVEEILRTGDVIKPALIVMGRHGHGAMYKLLVGSVTEGVLKRSGRPVLLVPASRS